MILLVVDILLLYYTFLEKSVMVAQDYNALNQCKKICIFFRTKFQFNYKYHNLSCIFMNGMQVRQIKMTDQHLN